MRESIAIVGTAQCGKCVRETMRERETVRIGRLCPRESGWMRGRCSFDGFDCARKRAHGRTKGRARAHTSTLNLCSTCGCLTSIIDRMRIRYHGPDVYSRYNSIYHYLSRCNSIYHYLSRYDSIYHYPSRYNRIFCIMCRIPLPPTHTRISTRSPTSCQLHHPRPPNYTPASSAHTRTSARSPLPTISLGPR